MGGMPGGMGRGHALLDARLLREMRHLLLDGISGRGNGSGGGQMVRMMGLHPRIRMEGTP